jgi:hypothetical protein
MPETNWLIVSRGNVTGGTVDLPDPPANVTIGTPYQEYTDPDHTGKRLIRIYVPITPPADPEFKGVEVWLEDPDQTTTTAFTLGTSQLGGTHGLVGEWRPKSLGTHPYTAGKPVVVEVEQPAGVSANIRLWLGSYSFLAPARLVRSGAGATASVVVTISRYAGAIGAEYSQNVLGFTLVSNETINVDGKLKRRIETGWQNPQDARTIGVMGDIVGADGKVLHSGAFGLLGVTTAGGAIWVWDEPASATTWELRARAMSKEGVNSYARGVTPELSVSVGTAGGTIDPIQLMLEKLAAHLGVTSGVFGVLPESITHELVAADAIDTINLVDEAVGTNQLAPFATTAAKIANAAIQNAHFDRATAFKIAIQDADIVNLAAAKISAGILISSVQYSGTVNANQVNAGTFNGHSLVLNQNGITTRIDNSFAAAGYSGVQVSQNSGNTFKSLMKPDRVEVLDTSQSFVLVRMGAWPGNYGEVNVYSAPGVESVRLDGSLAAVYINGVKVLGTRQTIGGGGDTLANLYIAMRAHGLIA